MGAYGPNGEPRREAQEILHLVRRGVETEDSARALISVPPRLARFLSADEVAYRGKVLAYFERMVQPPETVRTPRPPSSTTSPPDIPAPTEILARVARHFGITVEQLTEHRRGMSPGNGVPRWTAVHLLRALTGLTYPQIRPLLSYADGQGVYDSTLYLARARRRDPALDRDITMLLESMRENSPGTNLPPHAPTALLAASVPPNEPHRTQRCNRDGQRRTS